MVPVVPDHPPFVETTYHWLGLVICETEDTNVGAADWYSDTVTPPTAEGLAIGIEVELLRPVASSTAEAVILYTILNSAPVKVAVMVVEVEGCWEVVEVVEVPIGRPVFVEISVVNWFVLTGSEIGLVTPAPSSTILSVTSGSVMLAVVVTFASGMFVHESWGWPINGEVDGVTTYVRLVTVGCPPISVMVRNMVILLLGCVGRNIRPAITTSTIAAIANLFIPYRCAKSARRPARMSAHILSWPYISGFPESNQ